MVKTLRLSNHKNHSDLMKIKGALQAETGEYTSMDKTIAFLVELYKKKKRK